MHIVQGIAMQCNYAILQIMIRESCIVSGKARCILPIFSNPVIQARFMLNEQKILHIFPISNNLELFANRCNIYRKDERLKLTSKAKLVAYIY